LLFNLFRISTGLFHSHYYVRPNKQILHSSLVVLVFTVIFAIVIFYGLLIKLNQFIYGLHSKCALLDFELKIKYFLCKISW